MGVCALSLAVGIRSVVDVEQAGGDLEMLAGTGTLVYIVLFFGVTFMVSAAAVLALQQMSETSPRSTSWIGCCAWACRRIA